MKATSLRRIALVLLCLATDSGAFVPAFRTASQKAAFTTYAPPSSSLYQREDEEGQYRHHPRHHHHRESLIVLFAKKKKNDARAAALEALEQLEGLDDDEPISLKDAKAMAKKKKKQQKKAVAVANFDDEEENEQPKLSKKELKAQMKANGKQGGGKQKVASSKAAALAALDDLDMNDKDAAPKMSRKEMKVAAKRDGGAKQKASDAKAAALAALDELDMGDDVPRLSKKELKKQAKAAQQAQPIVDEIDVDEPVVEEPPAVPEKKTNPKDAALAKLLEMEAADAARQAAEPADDQPKLSKKELKALKKKEEKEAAKRAKKEARKKEMQTAMETVTEEQGEEEVALAESDLGSPPVMGGEAPPGAPSAKEKEKLTLEEKIRKERPPPRIRVMETSQPGYIALRLEDVGVTFRDQEVLKGVTWGVQTGDRIGLVGQNGAGKTTQLRILAGELEPTTGDVVKSSKTLRVSMLRQEFIDELVKERTLKEEFMSVFAEEYGILDEIRNAEMELENLTGDDADRMQDILDRMQDLQNQAENKGVYALESRCKKIMDLMGFTEDEGDDLVASFSGGWKMRIGLGKVLLKEPNVLLLDEPTNHLDLESVEWLEEFLRQQNIPMIIVSHDREFLDQVCTKIVDAEGGMCTEYDGNYSRFLSLKKARMDSWNAAFSAQEKKIKEEKQWINKFKLKQPQAVKQRQAKLEKFMKSEEYVKKPPFLGKPFKFRFPDAPRISPEVAEVRKLSHSYKNEISENKLFDDVDLFVEKGDRIAVVGPNGSGKSTLLRLLLGREEPSDGGTADIVGSNVVVNYFEQNQADALDLEKSVVNTVQASSNGQSYNELRALLGQFLFKGDSVEKKVKFLSGGEKARLSLCCMMLRPANLLILDEPTNHLDIPAKEMLEEALQYFAGSVVVVSHDRFFISRVANTIVAIEDKKLVKYQGDYKFYLEKSKEIKEKVESRYVQGVAKIESAPVIDLEALNKPRGNFGGAKTANMVSRKNKGIKNAKRQNLK